MLTRCTDHSYCAAYLAAADAVHMAEVVVPNCNAASGFTRLVTWHTYISHAEHCAIQNGW